MKKILCIMHLPPPLHGASQSNSNIANSSVINSNFNLRIINLQFARSLSELRKFSFRKVLISFKYCFIIINMVRKFKPDLVYFTLSPNGFAFYRDALYTFILKLFRLKILFHLHGRGIKIASGDSQFKKKIYKMVFKDSEVICLTNNLIEDLEGVYFKKPFIVPYGINVEKESIKSNIKRNNSEVQILYLGNYKESKGILILIDVLNILKTKGYKFKSRLVGGPSDLSIDELKKYVKDMALESEVEVTGPRYDMEKYAEYKTADIFVFPTYYSNEAFPLVNLEAMQFGLPVISTDVGGISEAIRDNENGFVIEPKNIDQLVDKLSVLINNKELREKMGEKGKVLFFNHFTLYHFEQNLKNVFGTVLNK